MYQIFIIRFKLLILKKLNDPKTELEKRLKSVEGWSYSFTIIQFSLFHWLQNVQINRNDFRTKYKEEKNSIFSHNKYSEHQICDISIKHLKPSEKNIFIEKVRVKNEIQFPVDDKRLHLKRKKFKKKIIIKSPDVCYRKRSRFGLSK